MKSQDVLDSRSPVLHKHCQKITQLRVPCMKTDLASWFKDSDGGKATVFSSKIQVSVYLSCRSHGSHSVSTASAMGFPASPR